MMLSEMFKGAELRTFGAPGTGKTQHLARLVSAGVVPARYSYLSRRDIARVFRIPLRMLPRPGDPMPLRIDGNDYRRRQRARVKRGKRS